MTRKLKRLHFRLTPVECGSRMEPTTTTGKWKRSDVELVTRITLCFTVVLTIGTEPSQEALNLLRYVSSSALYHRQHRLPNTVLPTELSTLIHTPSTHCSTGHHAHPCYCIIFCSIFKQHMYMDVPVLFNIHTAYV